jgi:prepilin-type N-terminal cleavage/methylation domain-containing protein
LSHAINSKSHEAGFSLSEALVTVSILGVLSSISFPSFMGQMQRTHQRETVTTVTQAMDLVITTYDEEDNILPNGWNDFRRDFMTDTGVASGATFSAITLPGANYTLSGTGGGLEPRYVFTATPIDAKSSEEEDPEIVSGASGFNVLGCINVQTGASNIQIGDGTTAATTADLTCP